MSDQTIAAGIEALDGVVREARQASHLRREVEMLSADRAAWKKLAKELGAGVTVTREPSRNLIRVEVVVDSALAAQVGSQDELFDIVAHRFVDQFKAALRKAGIK